MCQPLHPFLSVTLPLNTYAATTAFQHTAVYSHGFVTVILMCTNSHTQTIKYLTSKSFNCHTSKRSALCLYVCVCLFACSRCCVQPVTQPAVSCSWYSLWTAWLTDRSVCACSCVTHTVGTLICLHSHILGTGPGYRGQNKISKWKFCFIMKPWSSTELRLE